VLVLAKFPLNPAKWGAHAMDRGHALKWTSAAHDRCPSDLSVLRRDLDKSIDFFE